jgi:hypothetical protein
MSITAQQIEDLITEQRLIREEKAAILTRNQAAFSD